MPLVKASGPLTGVVNGPLPLKRASGAEGSRTLDLCIANAALSQLSYRPESAGMAAGRPARRIFLWWFEPVVYPA